MYSEGCTHQVDSAHIGLKGRDERLFGRLCSLVELPLQHLVSSTHTYDHFPRPGDVFNLPATDQSGAGLVASARKLLVLSASLRTFAFGLFWWAVSA
jgi:hypothetical protein